jgi:hypothetical protein
MATQVVMCHIQGNVSDQPFRRQHYVGALKALVEAEPEGADPATRVTSVIGAIAGVADRAKPSATGGNSASPPAPSKQPVSTTPRVRPGGVPSGKEPPR